MENIKKETQKTGSYEYKRAADERNWEPNSFASSFKCYFCQDEFRKDYQLKLHLMLNHKNEDVEEMARAQEVLTTGKLDGCLHKCCLCESHFNSVTNITKHLEHVHHMSRANYIEKYGSSEILSRMFKCEICEKEVKHTRTIISSHMKKVHLISWKEYQDIVWNKKQGGAILQLPEAELFNCIICKVSVKYKREHINKKHQITDEIYEALLAKKNAGEDISEILPELPSPELFHCNICGVDVKHRREHLSKKHRINEEIYRQLMKKKSRGENITEILPKINIFKCIICDMESMDLKSHLERTHQITLDQYERNFGVNRWDVERVVKQEEIIQGSNKPQMNALANM